MATRDYEEVVLNSLTNDEKIINKGMLLLPLLIANSSKENKIFAISNARILGKEIFSIVNGDNSKLENFAEKAFIGRIKISAIGNEEAIVFSEEENPFLASLLSGYFSSFFSKPIGFKKIGNGVIKFSSDSGFDYSINENEIFKNFFEILRKEYIHGNFIKEKVFVLQILPFLKQKRKSVAKIMQRLGSENNSRDIKLLEAELKLMGFKVSLEEKENNFIAKITPKLDIGLANEAFLIENFLIGALKKAYRKSFKIKRTLLRTRKADKVVIEFKKSFFPL
ncbi:MAG: hypothetical protein ACP5HJ_00025 [Candidatus Micrarchaeia archaeon]|jgi:hypothetical protein